MPNWHNRESWKAPNLKLLVDIVHNILFRHYLIILVQRTHTFTPTEYAQLNRAVHSPSIMAFTGPFLGQHETYFERRFRSGASRKMLLSGLIG